MKVGVLLIINRTDAGDRRQVVIATTSSGVRLLKQTDHCTWMR